MTAADKVVVVQAEERVGGGEKLRVEDHLHSVGLAVEQLTSSEAAEHGVLVVLHHVVGGDGRQRGGLGSKDTPLQLGQIVPSQQVVSVRNVSSQASLVESLAHIFLNTVYRVLQALGDGVTFQGLHVEAVCLRWENKKSNNSHVTVCILKQMIESRQGLNEQVSSFVCELVPRQGREG